VAELVPRTLDWIAHAPLHARGAAVSPASPAAVFDVLADHERWVEWFPNVRSVEVLGRGEGVGARRRVRIPMATVDEEFVAWEPGVRWSFTGIAARPRWTRSLVEDCRLMARADGGTAIEYTMYLDPVGPLGTLVKLGLGRVRAGIQQAMDALAVRAAR
jgi:hypothetical protein